ncbi:hypothetical protein SH601_05555 [Gracilibacillus sp. S3-1-1]|uniref:Uncharacterized protein n=1 Tax=Gracilibacillus pellucidus TaxID=3095368 RepID=A0ACC6M3I0_9BACI|nr:hypothetical protein [Gracilibacillus sp. S3-1-1]MDX8045451.1 hypothetical protein [Gracilibacillus sp. S3-1-1]
MRSSTIDKEFANALKVVIDEQDEDPRAKALIDHIKALGEGIRKEV